MSEVRLLAPELREQIFEMLRDEALPVQPFAVGYGDFAVAADALTTLPRTNAATYQLRHAGAEAGQRDGQPVRLLLRRDSPTKLGHAFQYPHGWRDVVYNLGSTWQTDTEILIGFRMMNGGAGRNRWFGRRDGKLETRTPFAMEQLATRLRQELRHAFAAENQAADAGLPDQWLTVARLPLATPTMLQATAETKTLLLRQLSQALAIGEVLRRQSFNEETPDSNLRPMTYPLNQILYGPPGTGKTYSTTAWALALLNPNNLPVEEVVAHYDGNEAAMQQAFEQHRQQGQIGFVSFHQSFGYEDFVEGIKPMLNDEDEEDGQLSYQIEAGIFKRMAERAIYGLQLQRQARELAAGVSSAPTVDFDTLFTLFVDDLVERLQRGGPGSIVLPSSQKNVVFKGLSPTGALRFHHQDGDAAQNIAFSKNSLGKMYRAFGVPENPLLNQDIAQVVGGGNLSVARAVFQEFKKFEQQAHAQPAVNQQTVVNLTEQLHRALTQPKLASSIARNFDFTQITPNDYAEAPRFVLIIDEINRGNVASIFGELISLLEDDKRGRLRVTLPYSKEEFTVPPNLYVLGTMNTADRSVEALDTALRRRFSFHELAPQPQLLRQDVAGVNLRALLAALNERLETLLDRDHRLGHAWLLSVTGIDQLRDVFSHKIIPQLQEYFYGHWGRMGQVLGSAFVRRVASTTALMPGFDEDGEGGEPQPRYELTPAGEWTAATFQKLYAH
ncbi:MAG: hypothetical protein JWP58_618 [Hymenobacter sp.]|nr:hypothetical protein [Hymenobacter sp.]